MCAWLTLSRVVCWSCPATVVLGFEAGNCHIYEGTWGNVLLGSLGGCSESSGSVFGIQVSWKAHFL